MTRNCQDIDDLKASFCQDIGDPIVRCPFLIASLSHLCEREEINGRINPNPSNCSAPERGFPQGNLYRFGSVKKLVFQVAQAFSNRRPILVQGPVQSSQNHSDCHQRGRSATDHLCTKASGVGKVRPNRCISHQMGIIQVGI